MTLLSLNSRGNIHKTIDYSRRIIHDNCCEHWQQTPSNFVISLFVETYKPSLNRQSDLKFSCVTSIVGVITRKHYRFSFRVISLAADSLLIVFEGFRLPPVLTDKHDRIKGHFVSALISCA
jgi:hypothetical protein